MRWVVLGGIATCMAAAIACGAFSSAPDPEPVATDGGPNGGDSSAVADTAPAEDATTKADGGSYDLTYRQPCPRPAAPGAACAASKTSCKRTRIHQPKERAHPFGIVVDSRHVFWISQPFGVDGYNGHAPGTLWRVDRASGTVVELARAQVKANALFAHGADLYWVAQGSAGLELRTVRKDAVPCGVDCSAPQTIATGLLEAWYIGALSTDSLFVAQGNGNIVHVSLADKPPTRRIIAAVGDYPGWVEGPGIAFVGGRSQPSVRRFRPDGSDAGLLGSFAPRDAGAYVGALYLTTSCADVFGLAYGNKIERLSATSDGGVFAPFSSLAPTFATYAAGSDARFLYYGGANAGGLRRIDSTASSPVSEELVPGSVWRFDVADDVIAYGEHGSSPSDPGEDVGSIFLIEK